ncbi:GlmU family protein [Myroides sp. LJL119]
MNYILFDGDVRDNLLPFTYTRPVADIRVGILTIREKWEKYLGYTTTTLTQDYLSDKFPMVEMQHNVMINAAYLPTLELVEQVKSLQKDQAIIHNQDIIAFYTLEDQDQVDFDTYKIMAHKGDLVKIQNTWDIFQQNDYAIRQDFTLLTQGEVSQAIPESVHVIGKENIFIEQGAQLDFVSLNASSGPIYIGKDTTIMEGALIRGPFALCQGAQVKMGAKIYGATTIGPESRVGGEISNSVIFGYSNKGHDGFLGNAVLGEWCNIGADSNNSNLKNNYAPVKLWNMGLKKYESTGLQFCGLIMGDHSKCGINTMFNTGSMVGIGCSIFGGGFPSTFINNFTWGGVDSSEVYDLQKALVTMEIVMKRRNLELTQEDKQILKYVWESTNLERYELSMRKGELE